MPIGWLRSIPGDRGVRSVGRRGGVLLAGQLAAGLFAFLLAVFLARQLGATGYGRFALITTAVTIVYQVIDVRIWEASTRYASGYLATGEPLRARAVMELSLPLNFAGGIIATALLVLAAGLIADAFVKDPDLAGAVRAYAFVAPFVALQAACHAIFRVFDRFATLAALSAIAAAARLAAAALAVSFGGGLREILLALLVAEVASGALFVALAWRAVVATLPSSAGFATHVAAIRDELPGMGRFLAASNATGTLRLLNQQADVLVVGLLATPALAGALKLARSFTVPLVMLSHPFYQAIYPQFVRDVAQGRRRELERLLRRLTGAMALLLVPVAAAIAATAPILVPLLVGEGFGQTPSTIVPLAAGTLVVAILFWAHPAALALDMQLLSLRVLAIATAAQIALLFLLVPPLGAPGAGLAYLVLAVIWMSLLVPPVLRRTAPSEPAPPGVVASPSG